MKKIIKKILIKLLTLTARAILWQHKPYIIAVTGNLGKTTTKDSLVSGLSNLYVRGSDKSLNTSIGIPLTIIGSDNPWNNVGKWLMVFFKAIKTFFINDYPDYLILEVGADSMGDILSVTKWLRPQIVVITQFAPVPVHIENFDNDRELLIREKEYLAMAAEEMLVYNGDDMDCQKIAKRVGMNNDKIIRVSFGKGIHNTLVLRDIGNSYDLHSVVGTIEYDHRLYRVELKDALGVAAVLAVMPAILASIYINGQESEDDIVYVVEDTINRLNQTIRQPGRMRPLFGVNNTLIIDDTYNSSPKAVENGLATLREINPKYRRIIVLGDMKELGDKSAEEHYRIGRLVPASGNVLITLGEQAKNIGQGAKDAGMREGWVLTCESLDEVISEIYSIMGAGDILYIKGSESMRMEKIVERLLSDEHNPKEVLVRQNKEWKNK